ncbi:MAG TPA: YmaF family protein [Mobilitalea sp.]|nr:YmaF family protein [Mobilitalea sp.]
MSDTVKRSGCVTLRLKADGDDHYHAFMGSTGDAVSVGDRHVHYLKAVTTMNDGHVHEFEAATMIENPTGMDRVF